MTLSAILLIILILILIGVFSRWGYSNGWGMVPVVFRNYNYGVINIDVSWQDIVYYLDYLGNIVSDGRNINERIRCNAHYQEYKKLQTHFTNITIYEIIPELKKRGYKDTMKLVVTLKISDN